MRIKFSSKKIIIYTLSFYSLSLFTLSFIAPLIQYFYGYPTGEEIYKLFSPICHQYPSRSIWLSGLPMALCARCSGFYLGFGIAPLIIYTKQKYLIRALGGILILSMSASDWFFQAFLIYDGSNLIRIISGIGIGIGLFLIVNPFILNYRNNNENPFKFFDFKHSSLGTKSNSHST